MTLLARLAEDAATLTAIASAALLSSPQLGGDLPHIDPAALSRGAEPAAAHLVSDTIKEGGLRVPATTRGRHGALWVVAGGYVVRDFDAGRRGVVRVVFIGSSGERRLVAQSRDWVEVEVSATGRRMVVQTSASPDGRRTVVMVSLPRTGRVLARRHLTAATLALVTDNRVLVGRRARWRDPSTAWWNYARDSWQRIHDQAALDADVRHDAVVFDDSTRGEFCNRVAVLSRPGRTLWRSCRMYPHPWSPDGLDVRDE